MKNTSTLRPAQISPVKRTMNAIGSDSYSVSWTSVVQFVHWTMFSKTFSSVCQGVVRTERSTCIFDFIGNTGIVCQNFNLKLKWNFNSEINKDWHIHQRWKEKYTVVTKLINRTVFLHSWTYYYSSKYEHRKRNIVAEA